MPQQKQDTSAQNRKSKDGLLRGFKAEAERIATRTRSSVGKSPWEACPAQSVARHLGFPVFPISHLVTLLRAEELGIVGSIEERTKDLEHLLIETSGVHATVLELDEYRMIFHRDTSSPERVESDLMHEIAHILLGHEGCYVDPRSSFSLPSISKQMELEAQWLGAALQIPERGLFALVRQGYSNEAIAHRYGASLQQVTHRRQRLAIDTRVARGRL